MGGFKPPHAALAEDRRGERDVEKADVMRQVGIGKTVRSPRVRGSLLTCRNSVGDIKTGWGSPG